MKKQTLVFLILANTLYFAIKIHSEEILPDELDSSERHHLENVIKNLLLKRLFEYSEENDQDKNQLLQIALDKLIKKKRSNNLDQLKKLTVFNG